MQHQNSQVYTPPQASESQAAAPGARANGQRISDAEMNYAQSTIGRISDVFSAKVVGQRHLRTALMATLLTEGHILLESLPGMAKTTAAATLSQAVDAGFSRIQCTPDLLPSDIIGTQVYDAATSSFSTQLGPVHANFVLLDEINRSSAKTQSAMLEAMQERQTSIGGTIHPLPTPFMVLATQNPIEEEGTYVLAHAQLDRFLIKELIGYPDASDEIEVLDRIDSGALAADTAAVASLDDIQRLQGLVSRVYLDQAIKRYIVALVQATRQLGNVVGPDLARYVDYGASPRASIGLQQVARAVAIMSGRPYVVPEDVRFLIHGVLRHRLVLNFEALADGVRPETIIDAVLHHVATP